MEDIGGPSFSLHTAKTWKKNKGKRLVRSIAKKNRAADRRDNATVPLYVVGEESDGESERAQKKAEKEEREERNRKWREKKEREAKGESGPKEKKKVDKDTRNRMIDKVLRCQNCRDNLDAEIWECRNGHGFCGDCVDKDNAGGREDELEMGEDGIFRNKGLNSLRRIIDSDTNEDTLWLCTNKEEEDGESITLTEKTGTVEQEETFWRFKKKEELKRLDDPTALVPKTMSQVEIEDTDQVNDEELKKRYEDDLQKKIKTIDFFEASTTVKKSNISGYGDYNSNNRDVFQSYSIDEEEWNKAYEITEEDHYQPRRRRGSSDSGSSFGSNRGSSSNYSTDTELEIDPVSRCPICNLPIELRNPEIEKIAVIFNQMMSHRMKM